MRKFIISLMVLPIVLAGCDKHKPLPVTPDEVGKYVQEAEQSILQTINQVVSVPDSEKTPDKVMRPWSRLGNQILDDFRLLTFLTHTEFPSKADAGEAIQGLKRFLYKSIVLNRDLFQALMAYAKKATVFTPYDHYEMQCVLASCDGIKSLLSDEQQQALDQLKASNAAQEKQPFIFLKSETPAKTGSDGFTVLTLNTCFVTGDHPYLFGGVMLPWQKRVSQLAEKIVSTNADVVCLQEMHAQDATYALYEALKSDYTYFYGAIGPRPLGFSLETLGLPSGLFVASKYPIETPQFTLYTVSGLPMNWGFFDFVVTDGSMSIGHVYTTHMQSLNYPQFQQIRAAQLTQVLGKMESDSQQQSAIPYFLCGDLNIPYGAKEPGELLIQAHFYDDYNKEMQSVNENNRTCTDYITNHHFSQTKDSKEIDPNFQILDYALLLKSPDHTISTTLVPMNDLTKPEEAVTDHNGLLTVIK